MATIIFPGSISVTSGNRVRLVCKCEDLEKHLAERVILGTWYHKIVPSVSEAGDGFDAVYTYLTEEEEREADSLRRKGFVHFERRRKQYRALHTVSGVYIARHPLLSMPFRLNKDNPAVPQLLVPFRSLDLRAIDKPLQAKREKKLDRERAGGSLF